MCERVEIRNAMVCATKKMYMNISQDIVAASNIKYHIHVNIFAILTVCGVVNVHAGWEL